MRVAHAVVLASLLPKNDFWPEGASTARALTPIANRLLLEHVLDGLDEAGMDTVAIVVRAVDRAAVEDAVGQAAGRPRVSVFDSQAGTLAEVLDSSGLARFIGREPFFVQDADVLFYEPLGPSAVQFADRGLDALVVRIGGAIGQPATGRTADDRVRPLGAVCGCFLRPELLADASAGAARDLATLSRWLRADRNRIAVQTLDGSVPLRGGREALLEANRRALDALREQPLEGLVEDSEVQGRVVVDPTARIVRYVIRGPVVVGSRAVLQDAYVGPYTSIGPDVVVEGSEIEHSIVLTGACVRFVGTRLEGSVVGRDAQIGRRFAVPHSMRVVLGDRAEVTLY